MVSTEPLLARAVFARLIKVLGWQPVTPKFREYEFPNKRFWFFEINLTSDTHIGTVALSNHAYGLYGTCNSQCSVFKVSKAASRSSKAWKIMKSFFLFYNIVHLSKIYHSSASLNGVLAVSTTVPCSNTNCATRKAIHNVFQETWSAPVGR